MCDLPRTDLKTNKSPSRQTSKRPSSHLIISKRSSLLKSNFCDFSYNWKVLFHHQPVHAKSRLSDSREFYRETDDGDLARAESSLVELSVLPSSLSSVSRVACPPESPVDQAVCPIACSICLSHLPADDPFFAFLAEVIVRPVCRGYVEFLFW
jgi:hypothetical protein